MPPASKVERSMSSSSVSKRTGTSKAKPAVMTAPAGGAAAKITRPVAGSQLNPDPTAYSTPFTATRTVPPTGLAMFRL